MKITVAIPVFRITCRAHVDISKPWTVLDELALWAISKGASSIQELMFQTNMPAPIIVNSVSRLMRFRLVELGLAGERTALQLSVFGSHCLKKGLELPRLRKQSARRVDLVIEKVHGHVFRKRDVEFASYPKVRHDLENSETFIELVFTGGEPKLTQRKCMDSIHRLIAPRYDEELVRIDPHTASISKDGYLLLQVEDTFVSGLPSSGDEFLDLKNIVVEAALGSSESRYSVPFYTPHSDQEAPRLLYKRCQLDALDLIVGGIEHQALLRELLETVCTRLICHSTFIRFDCVEAIIPEMEVACRRGVQIDLLWGTDGDDRSLEKNRKAAMKIARRIDENPVLRGQVTVSLKPTGSHAKIIVCDNSEGHWQAVVGSCNWLYSGFDSVEMSIRLRDPQLVADAVVAFQGMVNAKGLNNNVANELAMIAEGVRRQSSEGGDVQVAVVPGNLHDILIRRASAEAQSSIRILSHKLGATARPNAVLPGEFAAKRQGVATILIYTNCSGPLKSADASIILDEAGLGVTIVRTSKHERAHAKALAWDDNDLVVTSCNWASASVNPGFPWAELGIHISAPNIVRLLEEKARRNYSDLANRLFGEAKD